MDAPERARLSTSHPRPEPASSPAGRCLQTVRGSDKIETIFSNMNQITAHQ